MSTTDTTATITRGDYYTVLGLLTLAKRHNDALQVIERQLAGMLGEDDDGGRYFGHVSDEVIADNPDADDLLRRLKITVEE